MNTNELYSVGLTGTGGTRKAPGPANTRPIESSSLAGPVPSIHPAEGRRSYATIHAHILTGHRDTYTTRRPGRTWESAPPPICPHTHAMHSHIRTHVHTYHVHMCVYSKCIQGSHLGSGLSRQRIRARDQPARVIKLLSSRKLHHPGYALTLSHA